MPTLIPIGLLLGVAMLWVFGRTSNQKAIKAAKRRVEACLYEMRLFTDEPSLVCKAQAGLLAANARYIGLMLVPAIVLAVPMVLLFAHLEAWYGLAPLPPGRETLVTVQMKTRLDPAAAPARDNCLDRLGPTFTHVPLTGALEFSFDSGLRTDCGHGSRKLRITL